MVYAIQFVLSLVVIIILAGGCAGSPSTSTPGSVTTLPDAPSSKSTPVHSKQTVLLGNWEFTLNSYSIKATDVKVNISVTSHFSTPTEYDAYRIVLIDQYYTSSGMTFGDTIDKEHFYGFYEGIYYPGDTKTSNLQFTVNPKSGRIQLVLFSPYDRTVRGKLFDLGEIK